jgi:hypothetical protein
MTDDTQAFCVAYKPSLRERFWRKMGFHFHLGQHEPDEPWLGWIKTRSGIYFDWRDRLRILISGHIELHHTIHTDTPSPTKDHTRFDWEIVPPGGKR